MEINNENENEQESINSKYIIIKKEGEGITSKVYKVRDKDNQNIYAAKVFTRPYKSFEKEVEILNIIKSLNNPYIINIISSGNGAVIKKDEPQQNRQYIIFDYASKGEIDEYIFFNKTPFSKLHSKFIFYKILKGVQAFHNLNICHRDLKLKNILLDDTFTPKICDFGFATQNNGHLLDFLGSYSYAAPEIYLKRPYDGIKADIFSLGVILLNLTSCKWGFDRAIMTDKNYYQIIKKCYENFWTTVIGNTINLSKELKTLYVKMVAFKPNERPTIEEIFDSDWMKEIKEMSKEQLEELENEIKEQFLIRESLINDAKKTQKEINNISSNSSSLRGNKSLSNNNINNNLFDNNLKPKYAKSELNKNYCIKLTGNINPGKFMNDLVEQIRKIDGCLINVIEDKFKFYATFEKEEEYNEIPEDMKEELKKLGITENEINNINDDENENIKGKRIVIQIKLFESYNGEYLLRFVKKEGELFDYIEKIEKIYSLVHEM